MSSTCANALCLYAAVHNISCITNQKFLRAVSCEWLGKSPESVRIVFGSHFVSKWLNMLAYVRIVLKKLVHSFHVIGSVNVRILSCMSVRGCECAVNA